MLTHCQLPACMYQGVLFPVLTSYYFSTFLSPSSATSHIPSLPCSGPALKSTLLKVKDSGYPLLCELVTAKDLKTFPTTPVLLARLGDQLQPLISCNPVTQLHATLAMFDVCARLVSSVIASFSRPKTVLPQLPLYIVGAQEIFFQLN